MRHTPKTTQNPGSELDMPVKQRILEQANKLFTLFGVRISTIMIAHLAHTSVQVIEKNFGTRERLVHDFLRNLMKETERSWAEVIREFPSDPEAQLRNWVLNAEFAADLSMQDSHAQLARAGVDLINEFEGRNPLLAEIEAFWKAERELIAERCKAAKFRDPLGLADKLLLLVNGARNERNCYGYKGPSSKLSEAGDDLMVAHGAQRKPPLEH